MIDKNTVITALNNEKVFIIDSNDGKNTIRFSEQYLGINFTEAYQLDVGYPHEEYGFCCQDTIYFSKSEFDIAFDAIVSLIMDSDIKITGKTADEVEIIEHGLMNVSHYKYMDAVIESFWVKVFGKTLSEMWCSGIVSAHGDKCYDFKRSMPKRDIPFNRSALLYLLTYTNLMDREKHLSKEWVVENYNKFLPIILEVEKEVLQKINDKNVK